MKKWKYFFHTQRVNLLVLEEIGRGEDVYEGRHRLLCGPSLVAVDL